MTPIRRAKQYRRGSKGTVGIIDARWLLLGGLVLRIVGGSHILGKVSQALDLLSCATLILRCLSDVLGIASTRNKGKDREIIGGALVH